MVNDRLDALKAIRKDSYQDYETRISVEETESFMSDFFNEIDETSSKLDQISTLIEGVKKKHSTILSVPSTSSKNIKIELEDLMSQISVLSSKVKLKLKKLEQDLEDQNHQNNSASIRIKKIQHGALTKRFVDIISTYNTIQLEYRQCCKDLIKRHLEIVGYSKSDDEIEEMLESGNDAVFTQGIIMETQQAKQSLADIEDRYADIIKLEKSVKELHAMFVDLAIMVENQGELIDHIEYNVEKTIDYVKKGKGHLRKALTYKTKGRKRKIILGFILIALIIVIGIIIYFSLK